MSEAKQNFHQARNVAIDQLEKIIYVKEAAERFEKECRQGAANIRLPGTSLQAPGDGTISIVAADNVFVAKRALKKGADKWLAVYDFHHISETPQGKRDAAFVKSVTLDGSLYLTFDSFDDQWPLGTENHTAIATALIVYVLHDWLAK